MNSSLCSTSSKRKRDPDSFDDEPNSCERLKNDVFINYSFDDIGKTFISHLKGALKLHSFTISDHTLLPVGQDVHLQLSKAIEESEIYVLVFSPNYASSVRCLDELVDMMGCFHKLDERKVLPVFYEVDQSHVRSQQGPFMEAFQAHNTNVHPKRVQEWRQALKDAGQLSGLTLQHGDEANFVLKVVEELEKMQRPQELHVTDLPVGIGSRAKELISTLRLDRKNCVLVVVVFGISGIGKTTIVKEVFNRIAPSFDLSCFLADIHYIQNWRVELPKALISCLTRENNFSIMSNHNEGVTKIKRLVSRQKVLLVLDDIDNFQQLESLGIYPKWFYQGSRIIVTTRDKGSLGNIPYASYHTRLLNRRESLNLFTRLMFARDDPSNTKFIEEVVSHAGGLPLVLKVWSRHFQKYEREQWPSILEALKRIPHGDVQKQLQLSYDSLPNRAKKIFLDIVCFFIDRNMFDKDLVIKVLQDEELAFFPNNEIQYLLDKSLFEIKPDKRLLTHHAIREMGLEIVRQENEDEPGKRTRLSDPRDVMRVLTECSGTESVESIRMEYSVGYMQEVTVEAFRKMGNLRLIFIYASVFYESKFSLDEMTPLCFNKLKYMVWLKFPFKSLGNIDMCNIVVLRIRESKLERLWEGIKSLKKLKILDVSGSLSLTKTGNFSGLENLEELDFSECKNLEELHSSIVYLQKLVYLDLRSSIPLKRIPWDMIGKLASLQQLNHGNLELEPEMELESDEVNNSLLYTSKESSITKVELYNCNITSGEVVSLAWSKHLHLVNVRFSSHPDILLQLHQLNTIQLDGCDSIQSIPDLPGNITSIKAWGCSSLMNLPRNISELKSLTHLDFKLCPKLGAEDPHFLMNVTGLTNLTHLCMSSCSVSQVPTEIGNLVSLKELALSQNTFSSLPDTLCNLSQLVNLHLWSCEELQLLPLLPSNLTNVYANGCGSLDVTSSDSIRMKASKESPFSNRLHVYLSFKEDVPDWCTYQSREDVLSFVAPVHSASNICGIILCAITSDVWISPFSKMYNKTKNTSHRLVMSLYNTCVMSCPLDDTTLMVEPGDSVVLKLPQGSVSSWGLRLIYESDVVDCQLVI